MGYSLIFENMLGSVLGVRDRCLKEDGIIVPRRAQIIIAGFESAPILGGLNYSAVQQSRRSNAIIEVIKPEALITNAASVLDLQLRQESLPGNSFESRFQVLATRSGNIDGIAIWFEVELAEGISLSTSPTQPLTHWKQTLLYLARPIAVIYDHVIVGQIRMKP